MPPSGPAAQQPYNMLVSLREVVEKEVDWLLGKGFLHAHD